MKEVEDIAKASKMTTKKADKLCKSAESHLTKLKETTETFDSIRDCGEAMQKKGNNLSMNLKQLAEI